MAKRPRPKKEMRRRMRRGSPAKAQAALGAPGSPGRLQSRSGADRGPPLPSPTQDEYQFCYQAALEYLGSFDHYAT